MSCAEAGAKPDAVKMRMRLRPIRRADSRNPGIDVFLASFDAYSNHRATWAPPLGEAHF